MLGAIVRDRGAAPRPGKPGGVVERARHSLAIDPLAPVSEHPRGPQGLAYDDPDNLMLWWGMGALTPWQTVVESTDEMTKYDLWDTELFGDFKPFEPIVKSSTPATVRGLARSLAPQLNLGLLSEANTYTWRSHEAMLSTAQDFRKGQASQQHHVWQATFSPDAQVFTTHPRTRPSRECPGTRTPTTGRAARRCPRSAQVRNVNVSIYAPLFASDAALQGSYMPYTHAYLPQDHFDEVRHVGQLDVRPVRRRLPGDLLVARAALGHLRPRDDRHRRPDEAVRARRRRRAERRVDHRDQLEGRRRLVRRLPGCDRGHGRPS